MRQLVSGHALVFARLVWWREEDGGQKNIIHSLSLASTLCCRIGGRGPLAKMNGFQRGLDSHPLYALDARSLARATPSLPRQAIYTLHVPSGGLHYRSDTTQSCKVEAAAAAGKSN